MNPQQKVVSADSHIFEPGDLWEQRIEKPFRDRAPRMIRNHEGKEGTFLVAEGLAPYSIGVIAALNKKPEELAEFNKASVDQLRVGGWDPAERLKDQETDGLSAEVIYATYAMFLFALSDGDLQEACFRTYNDWLAEYCGYAPDRLAGLGLVSVYNVDQAIAELQRCAKLGMKGAMISVVPAKGYELSDRQFDPFWSAAEDLGLPISLHILTSSRLGTPRFERAKFGAGFYMTIPHEIQLALTDIICHGVLERHPQMKLVLAEGDIGWIGHFLERIDRAYHRFSHQNKMFLEMLPSEYFRRQVYATFIHDRVGVASREFIGVDNIMWSSDYPHTDSTWPHSRKVIEEEFVGVPDAEMEKILVSNAVNLYGLNGA